MDIFDFIFTLFMILFPAVFTIFVRPKVATSAEHPQLAKLTRNLWLATGFTVIAFVSLFYWQPEVGYFMWFAFFPLWFLLTMPLLHARDPGWRPLPRTAVRSASLAPRDSLPPELRIGWIAITTLWGLLLAASTLGLVLAVSTPVQWLLLAFNVAAGAELWLLHWAMRRSLIESEPVSPNDNDAVRSERASFRRLKLNAWFIVATTVMLIFSLPPLLLIWFGNEAQMLAIIIGAGGGSLAGIGGGVFGVIASIKRAKINRLFIESSAQD